MLSEKDLDKLIEPLILIQREKEGYILQKIADRLNKIGEMTPSDIYKLERLLKSGSDAQQINKKLSLLTRKSETEIKNIIKTVAKDVYVDAKPFYEYQQQSYIPFEQNVELQQLINSVQIVTLNEFTRLSNSTAFMLRDSINKNILQLTPVAEVYNTVIDRAIYSVASNLDTYNQVIPDAIKSLSESGIKTVVYTSESGRVRHERLDSAVRRNILDGIRDIHQKADILVGEQIGADGIELSAHEFSAPDHEPVQGRQFTLEEFDKLQTAQTFKDVTGDTFSPIARPIGVWNCRHFAYHVVLEHKQPTYTKEELERLKQRNKNGIEITNKNGEKELKSKYWCLQKQNEYELKIRKAKEERQMAERAGQTELYEKANARVHKLLNEYTNFSKDCGLPTRYQDTRIFV